MAYKVQNLLQQQGYYHMFTKQINALDSCLAPSTCLASPFTLQSNALEFQYDLCQIFLKKTGEQLQQKEAELMVKSQALINTIRRRESEKDLCSSTDSGSEEVIVSEQDDETSSHFTTFKRPQGLVWRKVQNRLGPCLVEIEEKCSALCAANIRNIMGEYRQLVEKWWQVQAREGLMERKQLHWQREHEENLILKQRLSSQSLKLETLECEIQCLKQKNQTILDYANQRFQDLLGSQRLIEINGKVYRDIKNYLDDKERNAASRLLRAQGLEQALLQQITKLPTAACEGCCQMLRKLKESLLKYRKYLQQESGQLDSLYHKYRKTLFSPRSHRLL